MNVISEFAKNIQVPIFQLSSDDTIGHGDINKALPMGTSATINFEIQHDFYQLLADSGTQESSHNEL